MPSRARCVKLSCLYVLCTVVVIDIYFFIVKPQLVKPVHISDQQYIAASYPINYESSHPRPDVTSGLIYQRCKTNGDNSGLNIKSCVDGISGRRISQSYTRYLQKKIVNVCVSLWDGFFLALEELEQLSVAFINLTATYFSDVPNSSTEMKGSMLHMDASRDSHMSNELATNLYSGPAPRVDTIESQQGTFALSARIQKNILAKNVRIHRPSSEENFINMTHISARKPNLTIDLIREANNTLRLAKDFLRHGNLAKARKLLDHARLLNPFDSDAMAAYGEVFEQHRPPDYVKAEHYYGKALLADPTNEKAKASRQRTLPLVEQIDQARFNRIDQKVYQYYHIPETHPGLRRLRKEHYFRYVYHSNAIEGNTLSLAQTRAILETRIAVGGKSLLEQNEVLGLDAALKFLNSSLLRKPGPLMLADLLEIHRRVLGYVDLQEAGRLRNTQVFIADFEPPPATLVPSLMADFLSWLNSEDTQDLHPVERAALAHWKLVYIHPFYDGNGRTARLLMNLILMQSGYPPAIVRVEERALYYQLIREANEGDVRPFIRFIGHCTEATIDEFLLTSKQVANFEDADLTSSLAKQPLGDGDCNSRVISL